MIRALTTLAGLACAAALLLLVPDTGSAEGGGLWKRAALLAAAGLVAGVFYQLGGIRRPGVRLNAPMLIGAFLPWTVLAVAICAQRSGTPSSLTGWVHDVLPDSALDALVGVVPDPRLHERTAARLRLVEPLVQVRARQVAAVTPVEHSEEPVEEPSRAARRAAGPRRDPPGDLFVAEDAVPPGASAPASGACSASISSATALTRRRELRASLAQVVEGRRAVDAVAAHQQADRALDRDPAVERELQLADDLVVLLRQQGFGQARLEQCVVGLERGDLALVPGPRAHAVDVERADRRAEARGQPQHCAHRLVASAARRSGQRGSALRSSVFTQVSSTNASTHGPSPACSCASSSRRATSSLEAT